MPVTQQSGMCSPPPMPVTQQSGMCGPPPMPVTQQSGMCSPPPMPVTQQSGMCSRLLLSRFRQVDQRTLEFPRRVGTADELPPFYRHVARTTSVQYSSPSTWKRHFATCDRVFRRTHQPTPTFPLISSTLTTPISSVRVRTLAMSSLLGLSGH